MAEFLNEHEQLEALKDFWKRYGKLLVAVIVLIIIGMFGWRYWQHHEAQQRQQASVMYESMLVNIKAKHYNSAEAQAYELMKAHPDNAYGALSALLLAKIKVEQNQYTQAEEKLHWVIKHSDNIEFIDLAKLRLARVLIAQKQAKQALVELGTKPGAFPALYYQVQGEAFQAEKQNKKAYAAFEKSLATIPKDNPLHNYIAMQKDHVAS